MNVIQFNVLMGGWNTIESECFAALVKLGEQKEWNKDDSKFIEQMLLDGCGHALTQLFKGTYSETTFRAISKKYNCSAPTISITDMQRLVKEGKHMRSDQLSQIGLKRETVSKQAISNKCKMCSTPTEERCSKCKIAYYCSSICQRKDHKKHKMVCVKKTN
jgi:hypothetical protein